jgi:NTE family protein
LDTIKHNKKSLQSDGSNPANNEWLLTMENLVRIHSDPLERRKIKLGLALGGGAVRGMAHVGVLAALAEANIHVDFVAGTSAGSIIGALYCAGVSLERMYAIARKINWWRLSGLTVNPYGFVSFTRLARWLNSEIGELNFEELHTPFAVATTDIVQAEAVYISTGKLAPAVQASCSIPGFVTPVEINHRLLVDGSLVNTIPVELVRKLGAEYVIGVDIMTPKLRRRLGPLGFGIAAIEIMIERAGCGMEKADCLISPHLSGHTYLRFSKREALFELGLRAGREVIPQIEACLAERLA